MTNMQLSAEVIQSLLKSGVREFCLCAGARNSPIIETFFRNQGIKTYHFFEERSAAFFAIGRIASTRHPVAVITTSGTAAAELLPATIEATYSSLPLILITADRPKSFRGTGAPQTIEQIGLFSYYIEACFDLDEENTHVSFKGLSWKKPIHINMCFKEPLLDQEPLELEIPTFEERVKFPEAFPLNMVEQIQNFCKKHRPVIILSTLPQKCRDSVLEFIKKIKAPIYAEGISGLKNHPELKHLSLLSSEKMVNFLLDRKYCDSIIRIGGIPTCRIWRDLEDKRISLPVLSIGYNHYTGISREIIHFTDIDDLNRVQVEPYPELNPAIFSKDKENYQILEGLFQKYPKSEPGLIYFLSKQLDQKRVYLGNSLPVREWDLSVDKNIFPKSVVANRGANGIDGQLSTFLGWAKENEDNWALFGDLTTMYDLSSLWITNQLKSKKLNIVIINNGGGMIFNRIFKKDIFLNRHEINFENWAKMWSWKYEKHFEIPAQITDESYRIIELIPDQNQTESFWNEWEKV